MKMHEAILRFVKTFDERFDYDTLLGLYDGMAFHQIMLAGGMKIIGKFNDDADSFAATLANLKILYQSLGTTRHDVDLVAIAKNQNQQQIQKFFMAIFSTAMESECKQQFIERILTLPEQSQLLFVQLIRQAMGHQNLPTSPTAQKKLLDKLQELEQENEKLQQQIKQQHEQKQLILQKLKNALESLAFQQRQNERLNECLRQSYKPQHNVEKAQAHIHNLKNKIIEISKQHEVEVTKMQHQLDVYRNGFMKCQALQEQLEYYQEKYEECKQYMMKYETIDMERVTMGQQLQEKEEGLRKMKEKMAQMTEKMYEMEEKALEDRIELERRATKIEELHKEALKTRNYNNPPPLTLKAKSLSEICPQINGEVHHLKDHNETLLSQLDKLNKKIKNLQKQIERLKKDNQRVGALESENKKLQEILLEYNQTRGQENELLVGCLYEMRLKYREMFEQLRKQGRMSLPTKTPRPPIQRKMLS